MWISRQIIREYVAALSRPQSFTRAIPVSHLIPAVRRMESRFRVADENADVCDELLGLLERFAVAGKQIHDANIVATMRVHGIKRLVTDNTADFLRFSSIIDLVPIGQQPVQ
jgi:predicted nucleic acid-binding protein